MEDPLFKKYAGIYFDPKNSDNLNNFQNRQLFLHAAATNVPGFAKSLFDSTVHLIVDRIKRYGSLPRRDSPDFAEHYARIFDAIRAWAKNFNIEADWVIMEAHDTVFCALLYVQKGIDPVKAFGTWRRSIIPSRKRAFQLPAWDPYAESEKNYRARADIEWRKLRDEHVAEEKADLEKAGLDYVRPRRKRKLNPDLRFKWAALNRCAGMSIEKLADQYREDTEAIRISVSRILKDMGFEPPT